MLNNKMKSYLVCILTAVIIMLLLREFNFIDFFNDDSCEEPNFKLFRNKKTKERKCKVGCDSFTGETYCGNQPHCQWIDDQCTSTNKRWKEI